ETLSTSDVTGVPHLFSAAGPASPVVGSPYTIFAQVGTLASDNYDFRFIDGKLAISKAPLTIVADDQSKGFGAAVPALSASYHGFVNDAPPASLDSPVILTTTATATSPVAGSPYPIDVSGAVSQNYAITFINGTLTVSQTSPPMLLVASPPIADFGQ